MSGGGHSDNKVKETKAQQEQSRIAIDKYNDYQKRFAPLEDRLMGEVRTSPAEYAQGEGQAGAAAEQQFANARDEYSAQQFAHGVNPASGAFVAGMGDLKRAEAQGTGQNMASTDNALEDQQTYGLFGMTQLGRGQSATALSQYGRASSSAQQQAIMDARNALNDSLANQQLFGQLTGAGAAMASGGLQHTSRATGATNYQAGIPSGGYGGAAQQGSGLTTTPGYNAGTRTT